MDRQPHDLAVWLGLAVVCLVVIVFLGLVKCQPDFFQGMTLTH